VFPNAVEENAETQETYVERKHQFPGMVKLSFLISSIVSLSYSSCGFLFGGTVKLNVFSLFEEYNLKDLA
jgi:hypothetical protein